MRKQYIRIMCAAALFFPALASACAAEPFTAKSYIGKALAASLTMQRSEQTLKQAENAYKNAIIDAALPSFTFSMSNTLFDERDPDLEFRKNKVNSSLAASLNLYDSAAGPFYKIKVAKLDYEYARLTYLVAKQNEALNALSLFYALYSSQQKISIARVNLESRQRQYKDTNEQYESGTRSKIEVTQSEGDKLQSELSLAQAESAERKARMAFNELIDAEPDAPQEVKVSTQSVSITLPLPRADVDKALADNFGLRQQRNSLDRTKLTTRSGILSDYPRLKVDASWRKSGLGFFDTPGGLFAGGPAYNLAASLNFPFGFFGVQNYRNIDTQRSVLQAADLALRNSIRSLKTSVLSAQEDIALQVKSRQLIDFQVAAQKDATDNLITEYSLGGADFLQLDSAQTKLLDASNSQVTAINDMDLALANYKALLGENIWE